MDLKEKEHPIIRAARKEWPPVFALTKIEQISGSAVCYQTIRNLRVKKCIPEKCFARSGQKKVIVCRDEFLTWWETYLKPCP